MTVYGSTWLWRSGRAIVACCALLAVQAAVGQEKESAPPPAAKVENEKGELVEEAGKTTSKAVDTHKKAAAEQDQGLKAASKQRFDDEHDRKHMDDDSDGHDDHGAHDPTDLSHNNATANIANPADIRFDMAIYSAVVFFLLLFLLGKFAWGPISHGLETREKSIADKIEQATRAAEEATAQLKQYEAKLAAAADEARAIVAQAHKDGEATREKIVAEANAAAQRERERAVADINAAKNEALREIAKQSVDTAIALAGNIVKREVKPAEHERLISDALSGFKKAN
jgi:F-type H+-transporting ATPase subunit b